MSACMLADSFGRLYLERPLPPSLHTSNLSSCTSLSALSSPAAGAAVTPKQTKRRFDLRIQVPADTVTDDSTLSASIRFSPANLNAETRWSMNAVMLQQELQAASEAEAAAGPPLVPQPLQGREAYGYIAKQQFQQYWGHSCTIAPQSDSALQQPCAVPQGLQYTSMDY